ncbi:sulfur oxidation protein SoxY [Variibacter gotjawalensis]|uniref:Sulfur oxidation protein SoxY n=2 Tax=Variibacter gotjawalensis TaxID=1333996 RepID=A0A0S3PYY8_9BRAD|nr:SoxY-related AACIE arm protein [Variibacter gotjawalensis]NIK46829.1 sulfur-oxidizing protein SoxY [Variibacter gotjawalensis]RZS48733.1 sulfur-oxidizing protein SoxY [Variibacter gotjawalensis]BAT60992.1 sulfur oxidation protein SoxY [Variibacter gotjawalensis]
MMKNITRRNLLAAGAGASALMLVRPASAEPEDMRAAIKAFAGEHEIKSGKVKFDVPPLVENGNSVQVTVSVDSPMTEGEHVRRIAMFNEKNPQPHIAVFHLGPRAGRARVQTRIRLANTQTVIAIAELSDGTYWSDSADVIVTLAACLEDL